jgi:sRNA-binding regulator protein Hfq
MKRAAFVAALAIVSWLVFGAHDASWARQRSPSAPDQQPAVTEQVRYLRPGTEVTVYLTDGSKVEGVISQVQDDALVLIAKKGFKTTTIVLTDIQRLQAKGKGHKAATYVTIGVAATLGALIVLVVSAC